MSFCGLLLLTPLFLILIIIVKIKMSGPVFFIQVRVGKDAVLFKMIKFRTMTIDKNKNSISVKGDSRITPIGAILRKYKIDELPELWNILIGKMSFVGPRPDVPDYADKLLGIDRLLLSIRPGLTGPASLKYYNEEEILALQINPLEFNKEILYPDKVRINNNYIRNWSFSQDIKIITYSVLRKKLNEPWLN